MDVLSSFVVIALCGVVAFFLYLFSAGKLPTKPPKPNPPVVDPPPPGNPGDTVLSPNLKVEQLDASCQNVIESYIISVKENHAWYISRPDAEGDIVLKKTTSRGRDADCAYTVSRMHAVIGCDQKGLFIQDNNSTNGMFLFGNSTPQDELPITDKLLITLGDQPIRFSLLSRFARTDGATRINNKADDAPSVIRRKRFY